MTKGYKITRNLVSKLSTNREGTHAMDHARGSCPADRTKNSTGTVILFVEVGDRDEKTIRQDSGGRRGGTQRRRNEKRETRERGTASKKKTVRKTQ